MPSVPEKPDVSVRPGEDLLDRVRRLARDQQEASDRDYAARVRERREREAADP